DRVGVASDLQSKTESFHVYNQTTSIFPQRGGIGPKSNTQLSNLPAHFPLGCQRLSIRQLARSNEANNNSAVFRVTSYNNYENHIPHRFRSQCAPGGRSCRTKLKVQRHIWIYGPGLAARTLP